MCWCHANACLDLLSGALDSSQPGFKHAWSTENALICDIFLAAHSGAASLLLSSDLSAVRDATGWRGGSCFVCETFQPFFSDPEIAAGSWFSSTPKRNLHGITATHQPVPTPLVYFKQWGKESATALSEHSRQRRRYVGSKRMGQKAWGSPICMGKRLLHEEGTKALPITTQKDQTALGGGKEHAGLCSKVTCVHLQSFVQGTKIHIF